MAAHMPDAQPAEALQERGTGPGGVGKRGRAPTRHETHTISVARAAGRAVPTPEAPERGRTPFGPGYSDRLLGFAHVERAQLQGTPIETPFLISHRFRPAPETWPCYQIGPGIFTVNVTNKEYAQKRWDGFMDALRDGLLTFEASHPAGIQQLRFVNVNLIYWPFAGSMRRGWPC